MRPYIFNSCGTKRGHYYGDSTQLAGSIYYNKHEPLARYAKLRVAHAAGMPGTFPPPPRINYPGMHHGKCGHARAVMLAGIANLRFPLKAVAGKTFPAFHSRRRLNPQFYVSGKRPMKMVHESLFALTKQNTPRVRYEMHVASIFGEC